MKAHTRIFGPLALLVTVACGSEGSGTDTDIVLPSLRVHPAVVLALPGDGDLARPDAVVRVRFSEAMDIATTTAAFDVRDDTGTDLGGTLAWDTTRSVLAFTPADPMALTDHVIEIDARARSGAGRALVEPFASTFSVAAGAEK